MGNALIVDIHCGYEIFCNIINEIYLLFFEAAKYYE